MRALDATISRRQKLESKLEFDPNGGCWLWNAGQVTFGYGAFTWKRRSKLAHRIAYEEFVGPIPDGMFVCHKCDVPQCCNPAHLFLGTQQDNMTDMGLKGRKVSFRGEAHAMAKISDAQAAELRRRGQRGEHPIDLGEEFGMSRQNAARIIAGKTFRHLEMN